MNEEKQNMEELRIKNIEKDDNAKKPMLTIILISSFFFGGFIGVALCLLHDFFVDFSEMSFGQAWMSLQTCLTIPARIFYLIGDLILFAVVLYFYRKAWKTWKGDADEDEKYEKTDRFAGLFMIAVSLANCFNIAAFGIALYNKPGVIKLLLELYGKKVAQITNFVDVFLDFCLTMLLALVYLYLQKKIVDLLRIMNPEKKGSAYDFKFHEVWYRSCDEAERIQIGNASYKAYRVTNVLCCILIVLFVCIGTVFEIGLLPIVIPAVSCGVMNLVYGFEALKKPKLNS